MKVSDYMTSPAVTANMTDGCHQTWIRMHEREIRHMPVLDEDEKVIGIVSDRDLRRPEWLDVDPNVAYSYRLDNTLHVVEVMTEQPETVKGNDDIRLPLALMLDKKYGAVPVVADNGRCVGVLSTIDLLKAFKKHLSEG